MVYTIGRYIRTHKHKMRHLENAIKSELLEFYQQHPSAYGVVFDKITVYNFRDYRAEINLIPNRCSVLKIIIQNFFCRNKNNIFSIRYKIYLNYLFII